jgi:hypothetical protein
MSKGWIAMVVDRQVIIDNHNFFLAVQVKFDRIYTSFIESFCYKKVFD